jgi:hypothetical protein
LDLAFDGWLSGEHTAERLYVPARLDHTMRPNSRSLSLDFIMPGHGSGRLDGCGAAADSLITSLQRDAPAHLEAVGGDVFQRGAVPWTLSERLTALSAHAAAVEALGEAVRRINKPCRGRHVCACSALHMTSYAH